MKKFILFITVIFTLALVSSAYAVKCPEPRKTKSAPVSFVKIKGVVNADKANGKKLLSSINVEKEFQQFYQIMGKRKKIKETWEFNN